MGLTFEQAKMAASIKSEIDLTNVTLDLLDLVEKVKNPI